MSSTRGGTRVMGAKRRSYLEAKLKRLERQAARIARRLYEEPRSDEERDFISRMRVICREAEERQYFSDSDVADHLERVTETLRNDPPPRFTIVKKFDFSHTPLCTLLLTGQVVVDAAYISVCDSLYKAKNVHAMVVERPCGLCLVCVERWLMPKDDEYELGSD